MQVIIHYSLHLVAPFFIAFLFFRSDWKKTYLILLLTMLVDLDHLLADPIFQSNRCSFGFHYLHTYYAMVIYFLFLFINRPFRIMGVGLLFHMLTDLIDCLFMFHACKGCYTDAPAVGVLSWVSSVLGI